MPQAVRDDYVSGGESRELIELALLESLAKFGVHRSAFNKVKALFEHMHVMCVNHFL